MAAAAAAAEVVCWPVSSAKIVTRYPASAKITPQVRPDTPAPTMATFFFMPAVCTEHSSSIKSALANSSDEAAFVQRGCCPGLVRLQPDERAAHLSSGRPDREGSGAKRCHA